MSQNPTVPRAASASAVPGRVDRLSHRTRRRAIALGILTAILVAILLLTFDAVLSARRMFRGISAARSALIEGGNSVVTGDPAASIPYFRGAERAAGSAVAAAGHPGLRLFAALPWVGENIDAVAAVAEAAQGTAKAGLSMADAASSLGWGDILLPGTTSLGDVDLAAIRVAGPKIEAVASQLDDALDRLSGAGSSHLVGPVAEGYQEALTVLSRRAALANDARNLFDLVPRLLGGKGARRYLLAVQSLAMPAGPGGRVGPAGVLTAKNGNLTLGPLAPADASLADALVTPNVPKGARAMLEAAAALDIGGLDGIILVDTAGLQDLLWMVGDVEIAGRPDPVTQNNAVQVLDHDVFLGTARGAAEEEQALLAGAVLGAALERRPSTEAFGTAMAHMVSGRHLAVYSTDRESQRLLGLLGATGRFDTSGNLLAVTLDSTGTNRTGTFLRRRLDLGIALDAEGTATLRAVLDIENDAPDRPPSVLLGPAFTEHPVGSFSADAHVYLPATAKRITIETSTPSVTSTGEELGVPVATAGLAVNAGDSMSLIVTTQVQGAATRIGSGWQYVIRIVSQPSHTPQPVHVRVRVPDGMRVASTTEGMEIGGSIARFTGTPEGTLTLFVRYA